MNWPRLLARLALPCSLALAPACGDDGDGDDTAGTTTAPGTTTASADGSTSAGSTSAEPAATETSGAESTGAPAECDALMCTDGEICVAPGSCAEAPFCHPPDMVICDFATGICTVEGVCSGLFQSGALVCDTCAEG